MTTAVSSQTGPAAATLEDSDEVGLTAVAEYGPDGRRRQRRRRNGEAAGEEKTCGFAQGMARPPRDSKTGLAITHKISMVWLTRGGLAIPDRSCYPVDTGCPRIDPWRVRLKAIGIARPGSVWLSRFGLAYLGPGHTSVWLSQLYIPINLGWPDL